MLATAISSQYVQWLGYLDPNDAQWPQWLATPRSTIGLSAVLPDAAYAALDRANVAVVQQLPREWLKRMKASIVALAPQFNTGRMVTDYARFAYTPAAEHWVRLRSGNGAVARDLAAWLRTATAAWPQVQVVSAEDNGSPVHLDGNVRVRAKVRLGGLSPADIHADVVFGRTGFDGGLQPAGEAALVCSSVDGDGVGIYEGEFQPIAGRSAYTIRLVPSHPELPDPFSAGLVRWA